MKVVKVLEILRKLNEDGCGSLYTKEAATDNTSTRQNRGRSQ